MNRSDTHTISFKNMFVESIHIFKRNLYELLSLATIPFMTFSLLYLYIGESTIESLQQVPPGVVIILGILFFITNVFIFPIIIYMVQEDQLGKSITAKMSFTAIKGKFGGLFFALTAYTGIMMFLGLMSVFIYTMIESYTLLISLVSIFLSIFMLKLLIDLLFYQQSMVLKDQKTIQSFAYSRNTAKKFWWKVFHSYFLLDICSFLALNLLFSFLMPLENHLIISILQGFFQGIVSVYIQVFVTLMFIKINAQDE
ncbi:hypothetical protein [Alkalibaculum bacchi]|uniref:hypothetical protein n=1 Tax=Alkalibaculum bacchi TaxID=645887 RepID=UPI0026E9C7E1|nr:hypothetical protein [Alkalibaculum bacchi]